MSCPHWDSNLYQWLLHGVLLISVPLYLFASYCLLKKSSRTLKPYSNRMFVHITSCVVTEVTISSCAVPVYFLPILAGYPAGFTRYLGIPTYLQIAISFALLATVMMSTIHLFVYRVLAVLPLGHFLIPKTKLALLAIPASIYTFGVGPIGILAAVVLNTDQKVLKLRVVEEYGKCIPSIFWEDYVYVLNTKDPGIEFLSVFHCSISVLIAVACIGLTLTCFLLLKQFTQHLSAQTIKMHRALILSLSLQVFAYSAICGIPSTLIGVHYFRGTLTNEIFEYSFTILNFHGVVSTLSMLILNKNYRRMSEELLYQIFHGGRLPPKEKSKKTSAFFLVTDSLKKGSS